MKAKTKHGAVKRTPPPARAAALADGPPLARLSDLCGTISREEGERMIREIEEAFEQVDGE